MEMDDKCPLCLHNSNIVIVSGYHSIDCPRCGNYLAERVMLVPNYFVTNHVDDYRYLLSAATRRAFERSQRSNGRSKLLTIAWENLKEVAEGIRIKPGIIPAAEMLLMWFGEAQKSIADWVDIDSERDYPLAVCKNAREFSVVLNYLIQSEVLTTASPHAIGTNEYIPIGKFRLLASGFEKIEELGKAKHKKNAFVAMWFDPRLYDAYTKAMERAIKDTTTLNVLRADKIEHNDDINDRILGDIRSSAFLIADFTGNRGGVYLEAGYAMGLGIPVIFTCFDTARNKKRLHFDTNHRNHIFWKDCDHLYSKLVDRIRATVPIEYLQD
jgi:nucleoside 2-deoxyribosyltransferase